MFENKCQEFYRPFNNCRICATYNWRHVVYHDTSKCTFTNFIEIDLLVLRLCIVVTDKCVGVLNNISTRNADIWPECMKISVKNFTGP